MKALVFDGELSYMEDFPVPKPRGGEALIRTSVAGICRTDLEIVKGYMDFRGIPGHEFVGVVEDSSEPGWIGKRVVGEINVSCHRCDLCLSGFANHCPNRSVLGIAGKNGAFAEYITLPVRNLYALPDSVADSAAVFVEPLAAGFRILEQIRIGSNERVILVGDGRLGLLTAQVVQRTGAELAVIGHHLENLAILSRLGIETLLEDKASGIRQADVVIDCSGSPAGFERSLKAVRPAGRIVLKSTFAAPQKIALSTLVVNEITVIASRCGPFEPAIAALANEEIEVASMISASYPLKQGVEAFSKASDKGVRKVLIKMD
jgi:threonine dehydrogenase-like Zn-dependent dehydrogenase